jgi:hypothetical protein
MKLIRPAILANLVSNHHAMPSPESSTPPQQAAEQRGNPIRLSRDDRSVFLPSEMLALPINRLQISFKSRIARFSIPVKASK